MTVSETWNLLIQAARSSEARDPIFSERCLRQALERCEESTGAESAETGLCLIELAIFLQRAKKNDEADALGMRYKEILRKYADELGRSKSA